MSVGRKRGRCAVEADIVESDKHERAEEERQGRSIRPIGTKRKKKTRQRDGLDRVGAQGLMCELGG